MFKYLKSFFVEEKKKEPKVKEVKEVSQKQKEQMKSYLKEAHDQEIEKEIKDIVVEI